MSKDEHNHDHEHEHEPDEALEEGVEDEELFDEDEDDVVVLVDAEGNELEYHLLGVIEVEEEEFALLTPADDDEESESMEVVLMRYDEDEDGGMIFQDIEDEALFAKVQAAAEVYFSESMGDEDEEES